MASVIVHSAMTFDRREREALVKQVIAVIERYDPFSLKASGAPADEFEPQARRIADARRRCVDEESCLEVVWTIFTDSFGESAGPREWFVPLAKEIFTIVRSPVSRGTQ
jgi:hypothetical protein